MAERAVHYRGAGDTSVIELAELPASHGRDPGPSEVAVSVAATGLNRADILQRRGFYPAPSGVEANVPGLEFSGQVAAVGPGVDLAIGARVMGIVAGGGFSSRLVTRADEVVSVPETISLEDAAAIPEAFFTAFDALIIGARLSVGETVLIHAVASGVGTAAVQLASRAGAVVFGTSRSAAKFDGLAELGLAHAIECAEPAFANAIRSNNGGRGADVVLDLVGASYLDENLRALEKRGRMVMIGLLGGVSATANLGVILAKRLELRGSVLRARTHAEKAALAARVASDVVPMLARGELVPVIDRVLPIDHIAEAHTALEANATRGKIVLSWRS